MPTYSPCCIKRITLISPARPAAPSRCPIFDFTEPRRQTLDTSVLCENARFSAVNSTGSPNKVPVPCASMYPIELGSTSASLHASSRTATCASALGAVGLLEPPLWLVALPFTTAWMGSPSRSAASSGLRMSDTTPSPGTYPSARESNEWHCPVGDRAIVLAAMT